MYTTGIRKILTVTAYGDLGKLTVMAEGVGYRAVLHDGRVWVKAKQGWVETPFELSDFEGNAIG